MELDAIVGVQSMLDEAACTVRDTPSAAEGFEEEILVSFATPNSIQEECREVDVNDTTKSEECRDPSCVEE
jgi:hypothetical protein